MRTSGKLFLSFLALVNLCACRHANKQQTPPEPQIHDMRDPRQELCRDLEQIFDCTVVYADSIQADSTCTAIIARPRSNNSYFYSDTMATLSVARFRLRDSRLEQINTLQLCNLQWTYLDIDSASFRTVEVSGKPYLYFETRESFMGNAVTERRAVFYMAGLKEDKGYALGYTGHYDFKCADCIVGAFDESQSEWKGPAALYEAMIRQSRSSKWIYHPGPEDADPYSWRHYETKWAADNSYGPDENSLGAGHLELHVPVHTTYYTTDLFRLNRASLADSIENGRYRVMAYFRSNLVGYDKQRQLYFPIVIEGCNYSCSKHVAFTADDRIRISYEDESETPLELSLTDDLVFDQVTGQ